MPKSNQKGFAHLFLILSVLLLLGGVGVGLYLVQHPQIFNPKASVEPIIFQGAGVSKAADGTWKTTSLSGLSVKLTSPLVAPTSIADPLEGKQFGISQYGDYTNLGMPYLMFFSYGFKGENPIHTLTKCGYEGETPPCADMSDPNNPTLQGDLEDFVRKHPHHYWTIFNEPELSAADPKWGITSESFAKLWYEYYRRIKAADPSATVFFPGMGTNAPQYQTFIPAVLQAYRAIPNKQPNMDGPMPVDIWTFHAYPSGIGCNSETEYQNGIRTTASLANSFINLINQQENGAYAQKPIWLTEWGWIRNHPGQPTPPAGGFTAEIGNSICNSQYMRDAVSLFKGSEVSGQKINEASRIQKWFTFANSYSISVGASSAPGCTYPNNTVCKIKPGWPDDDYSRAAILCPTTRTTETASVCPPQSDGTIIRQDKLNWYTWSGFLKDQQGNVTAPGKMYACLATHTNPNDCPLPAPSGTITLSPPSCTLPDGQTTCNVTVSWETSNTSTASVYEYDNYKDGDLGVKKSNDLSGSFQVALPAGRHHFNLFKTPNSGGVADLFEQKWITVVPAAVSAATGSITLSPASCIIPAGQSTCNVTVSWTTQNTSVASLYEYVSYKDGDGGVKKSNALSGSYQISLPAGRHAFNLFKTSNAAGAADLFDQKWITVTGGPTWSDNLLTSDLQTTTVTAAEAQKVQWVVGNDAVGTFKLTGNLSGDNSVIQVDIWSPDNQFLGTHKANEGTFTNVSPNRFAVILRNQGTGTTTFSNVSLVKQTNVLGISTVNAQSTPYTTQFRIAEDPTALQSAAWQQYTSDGMTVPVTFTNQNPGIKTVFVEFKGAGGETEKAQASITYQPPAPAAPSVPAAPPASNPQAGTDPGPGGKPIDNNTQPLTNPKPTPAPPVSNPSPAFMRLETDKTNLNPGDTFTVSVKSDTEANNVSAVDVILKFDPSFVEPLSKTAPFTPSNSFAQTPLNITDLNQGTAKLSLVNSQPKALPSDIPVAIIQFKALNPGNPSLSLLFTPGNTTDTNIVSAGKDTLSEVTNLSVKITATANPRPSSSSQAAQIQPTPLTAIEVAQQRANATTLPSEVAQGPIQGPNILPNITATVLTTGANIVSSMQQTLANLPIVGPMIAPTLPETTPAQGIPTSEQATGRVVGPNIQPQGSDAPSSQISVNQSVPTPSVLPPPANTPPSIAASIMETVSNIPIVGPMIAPTIRNNSVTETTRQTNQPQTTTDQNGTVESPLGSFDFNNDSQINSVDLSFLYSVWGKPQTAENKKADLNRDSVVNGIDYSLFLPFFKKN